MNLQKISKNLFLLFAIIFLGGVSFISYEFLNKGEIKIKHNLQNEIKDTNNKKPVRIGYFHGGRTHLFYRAYINRYFVDEGIDVKLLTKILHRDGLFEVPNDHNEMMERREDIPFFGRMTGMEIVDEINKGNLDGGTIGEASFLASISKGLPIIAVAALGHDTKENPAHAFVLRKGIVVNSPQDLKGKTFTYRLSGPVDDILTREFIESEGLRLSDIKIIDNMPDDQLYESLSTGKVDGGYYHLHWVKQFVKDGIGYVYRKLDWINPEASLAVLVFHRDFIEGHREDVQGIVNAYVKRIKYENGLPEEERKMAKEFGLQMINDDIEGMNIPQYDFPPKIRYDLLSQMQNLLLKYNKITKKVNIEEFIEHNFVDKAK